MAHCFLLHIGLSCRIQITEPCTVMTPEVTFGRKVHVKVMKLPAANVSKDSSVGNPKLICGNDIT